MKNAGNIAMVSSKVETTFGEATAVKALSSHEYEAHFHDDWVIGSGKRSSSFPFVWISRARRAPELGSKATQYPALHGGCKRSYARLSTVLSL
jgi:hypothetical protein